MTARNWRYCGSEAVMMRELVAGSAWICPPVEGPALGVMGAVAALLWLVAPADVLEVPDGVAGVVEVVAVLPAAVLLMAARRTVARLVALAFFR